jgi:rubrerythrin
LNDSDVKDIRGFIKSLFRSPSSSMDSNTSVRYYCMSCGNEHREIACPKCGSKMKRVG